MIISYFQILNAPNLSAGHQEYSAKLVFSSLYAVFKVLDHPALSRSARPSQWLMRIAALRHGLGSTSGPTTSRQMGSVPARLQLAALQLVHRWGEEKC
jgi:hypothetical protein